VKNRKRAVQQKYTTARYDIIQPGVSNASDGARHNP